MYFVFYLPRIHICKMVDAKQEAYKARLRLYTTVFTQCFSPCGKYLATGDNFGNIAIFSLAAALSPDAREESWAPVFTFKAQDRGLIYSLVLTDRFLISGGTGGIQAWLWTDIIAKTPKEQWALAVPTYDRFSYPEVNCLTLGKEDDQTLLYAGCGDNKVHIWNIETGEHVRDLRGHTDYVHDVALRSNKQECLSASEDGSVRIWDLRAPGEQMHIIEPYKNEDCVRARLGKWLGCVAVDKAEDWMVCGGGPRMCLWHLRSLAATTVFDTQNYCQKFATFNEDALISAGNAPHVHHWSVNGDIRNQVPCTPTSIFSVAINNNSENNKVLSIAGNSHKIDICTNFGYKAFSMSVC